MSVDEEGGGLLPAEPFARWLEAQVAHYGTAEVTEVYVKLSSRNIRAFVKGERRFVQLDVADRALAWSPYVVEVEVDGRRRLIFGLDDLWDLHGLYPERFAAA